MSGSLGVAHSAGEEPVLRTIRDGWRKLSHAWSEAQLNTPVKILLLLAGLFVVVANAGVLVPLAIALCGAYGIYRLVRALTQNVAQPPRL